MTKRYNDKHLVTLVNWESFEIDLNNIADLKLLDQNIKSIKKVCK